MAVIKLAQTEEGLIRQVEDLLFEQGLPIDEQHKQLIAGMIFQSPPETDEIDTDVIGKQVRGMLARRLLYFIMKPEAKEKAPSVDTSSKDTQANPT